MGLRVLLIGIVDVIGRHQGDPVFFMHVQQGGIDGLLVFVAVVLQLQKEILFSEDVPVTQGRLFRLSHIAADDIPGHFPRQAGGRADDALVEFPQQVQIHPGLVIIAFGKGTADDLHQVGIAGIVLRQQDQMIVSVISRVLFPVKAGARSHIYFTAQNGPDPFGFTGPVKVNDTIHHAMVRDGRAVHSQGFDLADILLYFVGTVQKRILCMDMKVGKGHGLPPSAVFVMGQPVSPSSCLSRRISSARSRSSGVVSLILV